MHQEFNTHKRFFQFVGSFISALAVMYIYYGLIRDEARIHSVIFIVIGLYSVVLLYYFRDCKIVFYDEKIDFFYLYRKKRTMLWDRIRKIEIEEETKGVLRIKSQLVHFYGKDKICSFNISNIDKERLMKLLISLCSHKNIRIKTRMKG